MVSRRQRDAERMQIYGFFSVLAREQYNNARTRAGMRTRERDAAGYVKICECVRMSPEGSREYRARRMRIFTYVPAR